MFKDTFASCLYPSVTLEPAVQREYRGLISGKYTGKRAMNAGFNGPHEWNRDDPVSVLKPETKKGKYILLNFL